jgi:tetratricopeptide (TPR) repeat protein
MNLASKILAVVAVGLLCSPSYAQIGQGSIGGKVLDRDGKPLQGAIVRIESLASHQIDNFKTNKNGVYSASGLYQSQYKVTLIVDGLAVMVRGDKPGDAVFVNEGRDVNVNFDLRNAPATGLPAAAAAPAAPKPGNDKADKKADTETRAAFNAGIAALRAKNYDEAIQQFQIAAEKDPAQPIIFGNLAQALSGAKKYDESLAANRKAIELKPDEPAFHAQMSVTFAYMGKTAEAMQAVQEVGKLNPALAGESYNNLGAIFTNRGKSKEAVEAFNKAIEIDPKNAQAYYQLGIAYFGSQDTIPQAISALEKFLQLQSTGPEVESAKQLIEAAKQAPAASKAKSK